jgi:hypothetical protein
MYDGGSFINAFRNFQNFQKHSKDFQRLGGRGSLRTAVNTARILRSEKGEQMKKLMIAMSIFCALSLAGMMTVPALYARSSAEPTTAQPATQGGILNVLEQMRKAQAQQLEGSWTGVVTPAVPPGVPQPPSASAYLSFARGGVLIGFNRFLPFGSPQHGIWQHLEGNSFAFTFKQDLFDGLGNFLGTLTVRGKLTISGKDEFAGAFSVERRDANGNPLPTGCGTLRATRIKIEPPAEQCQNLTPPQ